MAVDKSKIWFVRPLARHKQERQIAALGVAWDKLGRGPFNGRVFVIGEDGCDTWEDCAKRIRSGDEATIMIEYMALLPEPKSPRVPFPSVNLFLAVETFERRGAKEIIEAHTMRSTVTDREALLNDASKALKHGRSLPSLIAKENRRRGGKRAKDWDKWRPVIEREWDSRKHANYQAAVRAMVKQGMPKAHVVTIWRLLTVWRGTGKGGRDAEDATE